MVHSHDHGLSSGHKRLKPDFLNILTDDRRQSSPPGNNLTRSLQTLTGDLLAAEILPRLADARTVIRCSAVSKLWHSLLTAPEFLLAFLRHHPPATFVTFVEFRLLRLRRPSTRRLCPTALIVDEGSPDVVPGLTSDYKLYAANADETGTHLESSCEEFLLLSRIAIGENGIAERRLSIRNAATGLGYELPKIPVKDIGGYAALSIRSLDEEEEGVITFRVVYQYRCGKSERIFVFSSETGRWSYDFYFPFPKTGILGVAASGGEILWLVSQDTHFNNLVVVFNPFNRVWGLLFLPKELTRLETRYNASSSEVQDFEEDKFLRRRKLHLGVVKGQVRTAKLFQKGERGECYIMIFELTDPTAKYYTNRVGWSLVNEVKVSDPPPAEGNERLYLFSLHPDDGDIVFLRCGCHVYKYSLSEGEYERVFELSWPECEAHQRVQDWSAIAFTVRIPPWSVPRLPSSHGLL